MVYTRTEQLVAIGTLSAAIVLGWLLDALPWALLTAAAAGLVYQHRGLVALSQWAKRPLVRPEAPNTAMQEALDGLYSAQQRARARTHSVLGRALSLRRITAALPDAAVLVDKHGNIETFNDASKRLLRLEDADLDNSSAALFRHPEVAALLKDETTEEMIEIASPFADDERLELRRFKVTDEHDLVLVRDVTELNRLLSMRQDFIANVSHELRTPLTVLVGYLESSRDQTLDEATLRELFDRLESPTRRMQALVDDLLLLTRLEASPPPDDDDLLTIDVEHLVGDVIQNVESLSDGQIDTQISSTKRLIGVDSELHSALSNLVTNAIKYSPDGGRVVIGWSDVDDGARLEVTDHGMGIAPEHLSRLTERFYRVDLAGSRVRGGTGLGLAIVKHVLKRHNSQLEVDSELGVGSRFYCQFPASRLVSA